MTRIEIVDNKIYCHKCSEYKETSEFYPYKGSYKRPCKVCKLKYQKGFYKKNYDKIRAKGKVFYAKNRKDILIKQKARDFPKKDKIKAYQVIYRQKNKKKLNKAKRIYVKNREAKNPCIKIRRGISSTILDALKNRNSDKCGLSCLKYLPYTIPELKIHLENQFECWMTWENHGVYRIHLWKDDDISTWTWQIYHIIPHSKFEYRSMKDSSFAECWALSNLRPYSAKQNIVDGNRE
jgi:hypothetical protein